MPGTLAEPQRGQEMDTEGGEGAATANAEPQAWQYRLSALLTTPQEGQPEPIRLPHLTQKLAAPSEAAPQFVQLLMPVAEELQALSPGTLETGRRHGSHLEFHHHLQFAGRTAEGLEGSLDSLYGHEISGAEHVIN